MSARVVVLGGGISGLAAAHRVLERQPDVDLTLVEAADRLGGLLGSERSQGYLLEHGADSILTEKPWALALIERLGLGAEVIGTRASQRGAYVVTRGVLQRIPEGFSLLAPTNARTLLRSPILSWKGKARALAEPWIAARPQHDESLERFVIRRFGREMLDRLAQPLVGGIYGADPAQLSLRATMPRFLDYERSHGSVIRGLQSRARNDPKQAGAGARYGMFIALRDGMQSLVDALQTRLGKGVRLGKRARSIEPTNGPGRYRVHLADGESIDTDGVIVALPAHIGAGVLESMDMDLASQLAAIPYGSAATVTFGWPSAAIPRHLDAFGFVVPRLEHRRIIACTWSSVKFVDRAPPGKALLRVFFGRDGQAGPLDDPDDRLIHAGLDELKALMGIRAAPELIRVVRYPDAMPWYFVGHQARVAQIDHMLARHVGLELAGNAYTGVGIPDAIRRAEEAAEHMIDSLGASTANRRVGQHA